MSSTVSVHDTKWPTDSIAPEPILHEAEGAEVYQSLSRAAIASLIVSIIGLIAFLWAPFLLLPILGLTFSVLAWRGFRRYP
ncbi:MAG: hypothetical protein KatS3mg111_1736 [Pirellulaceae bacterium]|nr:MAG: hypothetical protein KatS3mg111_1736 [Pirellulaceae bacterium]